MSEPCFSVVVPATTANLGPGFDSIGIALTAYMTVEVCPSDHWQVTYEDEVFQELATDDTNLIVQTIVQVAERYGRQVQPQDLQIASEIPLGKGFGSSASAIATGIVIADELLSLKLTNEEKVLLGCLYEGHADNVSAALLGGVVINHFDGETVDYLHIIEANVEFVALVPPEVLRTTESRGLLPATVNHKEAVCSSTANGLLSAALVQNNWGLVGKMMEKDQLHERYRKKILPYFEEIRTLCRELGAYGMTISGAGPSLIVAVKEELADELKVKLETVFPYYDCLSLQVSFKGASII